MYDNDGYTVRSYNKSEAKDFIINFYFCVFIPHNNNNSKFKTFSISHALCT